VNHVVTSASDVDEDASELGTFGRRAGRRFVENVWIQNVDEGEHGLIQKAPMQNVDDAESVAAECVDVRCRIRGCGTQLMRLLLRPGNDGMVHYVLEINNTFVDMGQ
jgi:hypothetical protein